MKIRKEDQRTLAGYIQAVDTPERRELYRTGQIPRVGKVVDLDKRYRWDLFYLVRRLPLGEVTINKIYTYANDTHIDTLLRAVVKPL